MSMYPSFFFCHLRFQTVLLTSMQTSHKIMVWTCPAFSLVLWVHVQRLPLAMSLPPAITREDMMWLIPVASWAVECVKWDKVHRDGDFCHLMSSYKDCRSCFILLIGPDHISRQLFESFSAFGAVSMFEVWCVSFLADSQKKAWCLIAVTTTSWAYQKSNTGQLLWRMGMSTTSFLTAGLLIHISSHTYFKLLLKRYGVSEPGDLLPEARGSLFLSAGTS